MKNFLRLLILLAASALASACYAETFVPTPAPNPWPDDYSSITSIENYRDWGTYNVHDPSCIKAGDYYYMYTTDAILHDRPRRAHKLGIKTGYIQVRRSRDLVNWEFTGWAFDEIPAEAVSWVRSQNNGHGAGNIWAPYIIKSGDIYRLYYSVSAFGRKTSYRSRRGIVARWPLGTARMCGAHRRRYPHERHRSHRDRRPRRQVADALRLVLRRHLLS